MTPAYFGCAEFEEIVFFAGSSFSDFANVEFLMTKFRKECHFLEVHSLSVIEFVDCDFLDDADFRKLYPVGPDGIFIEAHLHARHALVLSPLKMAMRGT